MEILTESSKTLDFRRIEAIHTTRTRCYKLNLSSRNGSGPYHLEYQEDDQTVCSEEEEQIPFQVSLDTARLFRGIRVADDGTILAQNSRASRSRSSKLPKKTEPSRQSLKIQKAISQKSTNLISLIPVGEYDDMKLLVRDGSRKLREAEGLNDVALIKLNRHRHTPTMSSRSSKSNAIPKLKSHPRDNHKRRTPKSIPDTDWLFWNCGIEQRQTYEIRDSTYVKRG